MVFSGHVSGGDAWYVSGNTFPSAGPAGSIRDSLLTARTFARMAVAEVRTHSILAAAWHRGEDSNASTSLQDPRGASRARTVNQAAWTDRQRRQEPRSANQPPLTSITALAVANRLPSSQVSTAAQAAESEVVVLL